MTKHMTSGMSHELVEPSELSEDIATAPRANDGSGLKIKKNYQNNFL